MPKTVTYHPGLSVTHPPGLDPTSFLPHFGASGCAAAQLWLHTKGTAYIFAGVLTPSNTHHRKRRRRPHPAQRSLRLRSVPRAYFPKIWGRKLCYGDSALNCCAAALHARKNVWDIRQLSALSPRSSLQLLSPGGSGHEVWRISAQLRSARVAFSRRPSGSGSWLSDA